MSDLCNRVGGELLWLGHDCNGRWSLGGNCGAVVSGGLSAITVNRSPAPEILSADCWKLLNAAVVEENDSYGKLQKLSLSFDIPSHGLRVLWEGGVYAGKALAVFSMTVENLSGSDILVDKISPVYIRGEKGSLFRMKDGAGDDWRILRNSFWMGGNTMLNCKPDDRGAAINYHVSALGNTTTGACAVFGMGERTNTVTEIGICRRNAGFDVTVGGLTMVDRHEKPLRIKSKQSFVMNRVVLAFDGCIHDGLEMYGDYLARYMAIKLTKKPYTGIFCAYGQDEQERVDWISHPLTIERVRKLMTVLESHISKYGVDYIKTQFGGLSSGPGDMVFEKRQWSTATITPAASSPEELASIIENEGFTPDTCDIKKLHPDGVAAMSAEVHRRGFRHALVCRPFLNVEGGSAELDSYAAAIFKMATEKWGYDYLMFDFNSADYENSIDDTITMAQGLANRFMAVRKAVGDDIFIEACMIMPGPVLGLADGYRPAGDWRGGIEPELCGELASYYFLHGKTFQLDLEFFDPDITPLIWRGSGVERGARGLFSSLDRVKSWTSFSALTGYSYLTGGVIDRVSAERWHIYSRALPVYGKAARPLDILVNQSPAIWSLDAELCGQRYKAVGLFNWSSADAVCRSLDFAQIGLSPDEQYLVFDFWAGRLLGIFKSEFTAQIPPSGCQVLFIRRVGCQPQIIGDDRHVTGTQGLVDFHYDDARSKISGISAGPGATEITHYIYIPSGQGPQQAEGCECEVAQPGVLRVRVVFDAAVEGVNQKAWELTLDNQRITI